MNYEFSLLLKTPLSFKILAGTFLLKGVIMLAIETLPHRKGKELIKKR